jgi:uncharacterized RDD family membrane protein YckC
MQQQPGTNFNPYAPPTADIHQGVRADLHDQYILAERGTRLGAVMIDGLLMLAAALPAGAVLGFMVYASRGSMSGDDAELMVYGLMAVMVLMVLAFIGYQWYLVATTGQSLAKRWMGIKIVRLDGSPVGFVHGVILRVWVVSALGYIPFAGGLIGLVNALMIFGEERRCLHDHIAGTRVIVAPIG